MGAFFILGVTLILIILAVFNDVPVLYSLMGGIFITSVYGIYSGYKAADVYRMAVNGARKSAIVYILLGLIGIITSAWIASGTVAGIMYYGFSIIRPETFVVASFILSSIVSMILGTSFGTVSTMGIALMAIGRGFDINPGLVSGAIISGSYLGDRSSPMSSTAILTSSVTETDLYENLRHMMATLIPAVTFSVILYYFMGKSSGSIQAHDLSRISELQGAIRSSFNISPIVLLPPLIVIILSLMRVNIKTNMVIGIIAGGIIAVLMQESRLGYVFYSAVFGFDRQFSHPILTQILRGGGITSMAKVGFTIAAATALNGVFEGTKLFDGILPLITKGSLSPGGLILRSAITSILSAMYGCSQTLSIIMTANFMKQPFWRLNISNTTLARTIADTSVVISPIIPWNIAGLVPALNLGVKVTDFIPYAYLCIALPVITILYGYIGLVKKADIYRGSENTEGMAS